MFDDLPFDKFREECGVFAVYGHPEAANLAHLGLHALQHRGQESAGISSSDGKEIYTHKAMGHVADIFTA
ncbi:MAG: amidophosphoribosyltransferase, partial [Bryobacteraceae bacterium]